MRAINYFLISGILILLFSCSANTPKEMAKEYCDCFKEANNDDEKLKECQELVNKHREKLGKDPKASQEYADEIIRCAIYEFQEGE